jgi:hypothetical protein
MIARTGLRLEAYNPQQEVAKDGDRVAYYRPIEPDYKHWQFIVIDDKRALLLATFRDEQLTWDDTQHCYVGGTLPTFTFTPSGLVGVAEMVM